MEYFAPDYSLHLDPAAMENLNDREYLEKCKTTILANLSSLIAAPSVQFQEVGTRARGCACGTRGSGGPPRALRRARLARRRFSGGGLSPSPSPV